MRAAPCIRIDATLIAVRGESRAIQHRHMDALSLSTLTHIMRTHLLKMALPKTVTTQQIVFWSLFLSAGHFTVTTPSFTPSQKEECAEWSPAPVSWKITHDTAQHGARERNILLLDVVCKRVSAARGRDEKRTHVLERLAFFSQLRDAPFANLGNPFRHFRLVIYFVVQARVDDLHQSPNGHPACDALRSDQRDITSWIAPDLWHKIQAIGKEGNRWKPTTRRTWVTVASTSSLTNADCTVSQRTSLHRHAICSIIQTIANQESRQAAHLFGRSLHFEMSRHTGDACASGLPASFHEFAVSNGIDAAVFELAPKDMPRFIRCVPTQSCQHSSAHRPYGVTDQSRLQLLLVPV